MNKEKISQFISELNPDSVLEDDVKRFFAELLLSGNQDLNTDLNDIDYNSEIYKNIEPVVNAMVPQIFISRLKNLTKLRITLGAFLGIASVMETPAEAVMYVYYLHCKLPENTLIDLDMLMSEIFPWGFISKDDLNNLWELQKLGEEDDLSNYTCIGAPDNMLDYLEIWRK